MKKFKVGKFQVSIGKGFKLSSGSYYHINLLYIGIGRNGFGICILGVFIGVALNPVDESLTN